MTTKDCYYQNKSKILAQKSDEFVKNKENIYLIYYLIRDESTDNEKKEDFFIKTYKCHNKHLSNNEQLILYASAIELFKLKRNDCIEDLFKHYFTCINHVIQKPFFYVEYGVDIEEFINRLIWLDKKNNKLHPYLEENFKDVNLSGHIIEYAIEKWFIPRYDLNSIGLLLKHIKNKPVPDSKKSKNKNISGIALKKYWQYLLEILLPFTVFAFLCLEPVGSFLKTQISILPLSFNGEKLNYNYLIVIIEIICLLAIICYLFDLIKTSKKIYLYLPRLVIGIFVGYIPLLTGDMFWKIGVSTHYYNIIILSLICLLSCFIYLRYEVKKNVQKNEELIKRILTILSKGVLYTFVIGLFLLDLFYAQYLSIAEKIIPLDSYRVYPGILGIVNPMLLLFFAPVALFIGMVIQFIWEEKPITYPVK